MTKRIDPALLTPVVGTLYPSPFDVPCRARQRRKLGDAAGLSQFGINLLTLPAGAWSSQRHWHTESDEFIYVLSGDVIWFAPGEKHWHGATATTAMSHIAVQEKLNGSPVDWMEQVTDEQYRR